MSTYRISASMSIAAPPQRIYSILADYTQGHPSVLPRPPFVSMQVLSGGIGAGTRIIVTMRTAGRTRTYHGTVSEPQPGRLLVESYDEDQLVTSFFVDPVEGSHGAHVTIATDVQIRPGIVGRLQKWIADATLRRVYLQELKNISAAASV